MTYELNDKVKNLIPYDAVSGDYKIRLDANESFINPGALLKDEILTAITKVPLNRYPDPMANQLCTKFAEFYRINPQSVVAGNGSDELITIILGAFLRPEDKILTFSPDFSMYHFYAEIYEKHGIVVEKNQDFILNAKRVIEIMHDSDPQALILSNPCSPTSLVITREEIIEIVSSTNALVIIDEAYMEFSDQSILDVAHQYDNLIVLKTCSKALGLAAIRLGFAVACEKIVRALHSVRSPYNVNAITQAIGCVIFSNPDYIKKAIAEIIESREYLYQGLLQFREEKQVKSILKPSTNFVFMQLEDSQLVYDELKKESIIVRRLGDYLRITAGSKKENEALLQMLSKIFRRMGS